MAGDRMRLYLTQCRGGRCMLTALPPIIHRIRGTRKRDAFSQKGEPIDIRHLCQDGVRALFGRLPPRLKPTRVTLTASFVDTST